jgi:uncharacterized protein (DUF1697 family)
MGPHPGSRARYEQAVPGSPRAATHLALLRGLNVGGRNVVPMPELAALFAQAGCAGVRTYIQSGNVLFAAPPALVRRIPGEIASRILERHGLRVPVIVRSAAELRDVATGNPFLRTSADTRLLHVAFLAARPSPAAVSRLDPARSPPDAFAVQGREVYLSLPNGAGRTRITNDYLDRTLGTISTLRNWNTVLKMAELLDG